MAERGKAAAARTVLVTGGSRGLGLAIAQKLASGGDRVVAVARTKSKDVTAAMAAIESAGQGALHFVPFDLGEVEKIPNFVRGLRKEFGPLAGLVNNAALGFDGALAMMHNSQLEQLVRVNTLAAARPHQIRRARDDGGWLQAVSSTSPRSSPRPATAASPPTPRPRRR